mmetsp:Transcript_65200/g.181240  ORF Transcript_65200/g.181240 Transcript_65200/m.181240 type:complete len:248 (+) Transcript_65200:232-975(+)
MRASARRASASANSQVPSATNSRPGRHRSGRHATTQRETNTNVAKVPVMRRMCVSVVSSRCPHVTASAKDRAIGRISAESCNTSRRTIPNVRRLAHARGLASKAPPPRWHTRRADQPGSCAFPSINTRWLVGWRAPPRLKADRLSGSVWSAAAGSASGSNGDGAGAAATARGTSRAGEALEESKSAAPRLNAKGKGGGDATARDRGVVPAPSAQRRVPSSLLRLWRCEVAVESRRKTNRFHRRRGPA